MIKNKAVADCELTKRVSRLSRNQLRALLVFVNAPSGVVESGDMAKKIGISGKALGGLFSSLSRNNFQGQGLIIPLGKEETGRGLRWRLNKQVIDSDKLKTIIEEILKFW